MKKTAYVHFSITLLLVFSMLSPMAVLAAGDGKKHYQAGKRAEDAEQWDKAAEEYALAVTDSPKNPEYLLHYRRSLFMASQMFMRRGTSLANDKDYAGAYLAFRKSYAYDPTNELAKSETERMMRLQQNLENGDKPDAVKNDDGTVKLVSTGYQKQIPQDTVPAKFEKLRDVPFPSGVDLQFLIKELAKDLDLNVLFDKSSNLDGRKVKIELKNVTAAKALDYVFIQEDLFFQKVGPRTILVAMGQRRQNFQQLVLRTFYLSNADPKDVSKVIASAIPAQPGRAPTTNIVDEDTNSITVRDTSENIRIISKLIASLDKDRAEVVMDVAIYEVSKSDLLRLGNQIGTESSLTNLGGSTQSVIGNGRFNPAQTIGSVASVIPRATGIGLVIPAINLVAFQSKDNARLLASTQIHAFNNEDSEARIGQRVPVQTAQLLGYGNNTGTTTPGQGFISNPAASVINYEQVGLTLKFKPIVFPNQDVQVAMNIESKDVVACAGASATGNPCFSERTIKGTARIQNNKTLLLASAATDVESNGRQGLPLLGLIPILGRFFTAPTKNNRQVDIVIAVTPRVIRAPAILPEDEIERPTGSLAVPTSGSLEAMIIQEDREEMLAAARRIPNVAQVQLPDQPADMPTYTKASSSTQTPTTAAEPKADAPQSSLAASALATSVKTETSAANKPVETILANLRPIETSVKTLQIMPPPESANNVETVQTSLKAATSENSNVVAPQAQLQFLTNLPEMKTGEKTKIAVMVKSATAFRSAVLGLRFDPAKLAVRSVGFGDVFGAGLAQTNAAPFVNQNGKMYVSLSSAKDTAENTSGILAYIEVEALAPGKHEVAFDKELMNLLTADGKNFVVKY